MRERPRLVVSEAYRTGSGLQLVPAPHGAVAMEVAMPSVQVRPFRRADREQLTSLVNAHIQAVVPGLAVSVNAVMSQLERDPGEFIVDPWVAERVTLVAEQRRRVVAAAHLLRYGTGEEVGQAYRGGAEINWLLFWPQASYWTDTADAAGSLMGACLERLRAWGADHWHADGALPAPGVYGLPEQWPHVRALYERAGFVHQEQTGSEHEGHSEIVLLAMVEELPRPTEAPIPGLRPGRALGVNGTRLYGSLGDVPVGYIEIDTDLAEGGRLAHLGGWAEVGNLHVEEAYRRRGVATWLLGQAADWLRLARVERLLDYAWPEEEARLALLRRAGFRELTRTARGWTRHPDPRARPTRPGAGRARPGPAAAGSPGGGA
jgi:ribosomal protein S18 acetylase RimI-like enzyme